MDNRNETPKQENANSTKDLPLRELASNIQDVRTKDYVENRLLPQMTWYSKKSNSYRRQYQVLMSFSIALGAMIPVMSVLVQGPPIIQLLIALLGTGATAVNAYLSLSNSRDLWLTYRNTREILLRTLYFYFNNAEKFSDGTAEEKDELLIEVCEAELARENGTWRSMMEK